MTLSDLSYFTSYTPFDRIPPKNAYIMYTVNYTGPSICKSETSQTTV